MEQLTDLYLVLGPGAAGLIGSTVCQALLAEGHRVIGVNGLNDY